MFSRRSYEGVLEASHRDRLNAIENHPFRRGMGDLVGAMDKVQSHDGDTQESGSGSGLSDLSALENETDDFGKLLLRHQKDEQRMTNALRGKQQPFRRARPRPLVAERVLREEREAEKRERQNHERQGSAGSNGSDPPVTVPREWGRKARRNHDWMRKIVEPSEVDETEHAEETFKPDDGAIYRHRTSFTGDLNWRVTQEEALASIETTPPSMRRQRHSTAATPSSMQHMNTTLRPSGTPGDADEDFSSASLLASTPAPVRFPRKIDELTRREIESIERQGITTRAFDETNPRPSFGTRRRTSSTALRERAMADDMASSPPRASRPLTAPAKAPSPSRIPRRQPSPVKNKENIPPPSDQANVDTKAKGSATTAAKDTPPVNIKNSDRARHQRNDSMNLLRKLARVSSMSPSPARVKSDVDAVDKKPTAVGPSDAATLNLKGTSSSDNQGAEAPSKDVKKAGWGLEFGALLSGKSEHDDDDNKQAQVKLEDVANEHEGSASKTPAVTGAWQDSSAPHDVKSSTGTIPQEQGAAEAIANEVLDNDKAFKEARSATTHPRSALQAIMRETKDAHNDLQFGESTIQSLEDIVNPNLDPTDPTITFDLEGAKAIQEKVDKGEPLTQEEKDRRQEDLAIEGLNKHLRAARTSIKDASRGLRRVENRIEAAREGQKAPPSAATTIHPPTTDRNGFTHCEHCGGGYNSAWYALWAEFRSLFYTYDPTSRLGISFTWLGKLCLAWLIWYLIESTLCSFYCTPKYAYPGQKFPGPSSRTPRYPFTIPMVVFGRWKEYWVPTLNALEEGFEAWVHEMMYPPHIAAMPPDRPMKVYKPSAKTMTKAFSQTVPVSRDWVAAATATSVRVAQSVMDAVDEVGSMWDDEFL